MSRLLRGSFLFSLGILISRVLGYLRDAAVAYFFGASPITDAFFVAFRIPNTFRRIFGEGGFNAVFIPYYGEAVSKNKEKEFLSKISGVFFTLSLVVSAFGVLFAEEIISVIAPGLRDKESFHYAVLFLKFVFPYLFLVFLYAFSMAILMVKGYFFIPSVSQALFNLIFIACVVLLTEAFGYLSLIFGVLVGGIFQVFPNFFLLIRNGIIFLPRLVLDAEVREFLKKFSLTLFSFSTSQLSLILDVFFGSFLKTGAISYIYYAGRIYLLPVSLFSVGVSNTFLAVVSSGEDRKENLKNGVKLSLLFAVPSAVGLFLLSEDIVRVLYGRGEFGKEDIIATAELLQIYAFSVPFFSLQHLYKSLFYSLKDVKTPVKSSFLYLFVEGSLNTILIFFVGLGVVSIPISVVAASLVALLYLIFRSPEKAFPNASFLVKVFISSVVMGMVIFLFNGLPSVLKVLMIPFFGGIYFLGLAVMRESMTISLLKYLSKKLLRS